MTVLVVNELLSGGWLEYLSLVKLEGKQFEARREMKMNDANATDSLTAEQLALASAKAALSDASKAVSHVTEATGAGKMMLTTVQMRHACKAAEAAGIQAGDPEFETVRRELQRIEPMAKSAAQTVLEKISCDNTADDSRANIGQLKEDLAQVQTGIEGALVFGIGDDEQISDMKAAQRVLKTRVAVRACDEQLRTLDRETPVPTLRAAVLEAKSATKKAGEVDRATALPSEMASLAEQLDRVEPIAVEAARQQLETVLSESVAAESLSLRELEASRAELRTALEDAETLGIDETDTMGNSRSLLHKIETLAAQAKNREKVDQGVWDTGANSTQHTVDGKPRFMPLLLEDSDAKRKESESFERTQMAAEEVRACLFDGHAL